MELLIAEPIPGITDLLPGIAKLLPGSPDSSDLAVQVCSRNGFGEKG